MTPFLCPSVSLCVLLYELVNILREVGQFQGKIVDTVKYHVLQFL